MLTPGEVPVRFRSVVFSLVVCAACGLCAAAQENLTELKAQAKDEALRSLQNVSALEGEYEMSQVCRLVLENGRLRGKVDLAAQEQPQVMLKIRGLRGMTVVGVPSRGPGQAPREISLQNTHWDDPEAYEVTTSINFSEHYVGISQSSRYADGRYRNFSLVDETSIQSGEAADAIGRVAMTFKESKPGDATKRVCLTAPDFATLRQRHRGEIEQYIRPVLRDLRQEALLAADPNAAWQVFADTWQPDPAVAVQVAQLLPLLDAEQFAQRDDALRRLQALGRPGALVLHHLDRTGLSAQQNLSIDTALQPYRPLPPKQAATFSRSPGFLVDCLQVEDGPIRSAALNRLRELNTANLPPTLADDPEKRNHQIDQLRQQVLRTSTTRPTTSTRDDTSEPRRH